MFCSMIPIGSPCLADCYNTTQLHHTNTANKITLSVSNLHFKLLNYRSLHLTVKLRVEVKT